MMSTTKFEILWRINYVPDRYREECGCMIVDVPDYVLEGCCDDPRQECELEQFLTRHLHGSIGNHAQIEEIHCVE